MSYPPVQHPPCSTPYLDAALALTVALAVMLIAALAGRVGWLIGAGVAAILALIVMAWLENR